MEQVQQESTVSLMRLGRVTMYVTVAGTAPLIIHRFSAKAKQQMLDAMQRKTKVQKEAKDPQAEYEGAFHRLPDGRPGFPAVGFKAATIGAARFFDKKIVNMTMLRGALYFLGEGPDQLVAINGEAQMREDVVRVGMGGTDLRYRPIFDKWSATLPIVYLPSAVTADSIVSLVDAGGMAGIGEWRPGKSATGSFGTYSVTEVRQ